MLFRSREDETCTAAGCAKVDLDPALLPDFEESSAPSEPDGAPHAPDGGGPRDGASREASHDGASPVQPCVHPEVSAKCGGGWCSIPAGCFVMGSPPSEACRGPDEIERQVTLTHDLELGTFEVTQPEFQTLLSYLPAGLERLGAMVPVSDVTWHEAAAYCNALSQKPGLSPCYLCQGKGPAVKCSTAPQWEAPAGTIYDCPGYRLPTEAEWEYAYRAGTRSAYPTGSSSDCVHNAPADELGWYNGNSSEVVHTVGQKAESRWGLFDLGGNVAEWVHDWYVKTPSSTPAKNPVGVLQSDQVRALRGGSFESWAKWLRAAARSGPSPTSHYTVWGFRCARTLTF